MKNAQTNGPFRMLLLLMIAAFVILQGCSKTESDNVTTNGIHADIKVEGKSNGTTDVRVDLDAGGGLGGTDLELSDGDLLTARAQGQTRTLTKSANLVNIEYITTFDTNAAGTEFIISLTRQNGLNADNSRVILPAPFTLISPQDGETFNLDDLVPLEWTPFDEDGSIAVSSTYSCHWSNGLGGTDSIYGTGICETVADDGYTTYTMRELLQDLWPETYDRGCTVEISLSRKRTGTIDRHFGEGGRIVARQSRHLEIRFMPDYRP